MFCDWPLLRLLNCLWGLSKSYKLSKKMAREPEKRGPSKRRLTLRDTVLMAVNAVKKAKPPRKKLRKQVPVKKFAKGRKRGVPTAKSVQSWIAEYSRRLKNSHVRGWTPSLRQVQVHMRALRRQGLIERVALAENEPARTNSRHCHFTQQY